MSEDKKPQEFNRQKIELANKIANQSQKVANTYQHVEDILSVGSLHLLIKHYLIQNIQN